MRRGRIKRLLARAAEPPQPGRILVWDENSGEPRPETGAGDILIHIVHGDWREENPDPLFTENGGDDPLDTGAKV